MMNKSNPKDFISKPVDTLEQDNTQKDEALKILDSELKKLWLDVVSFREFTLKHNWYKSKDEIVRDLLVDHSKLNKLIKFDDYVKDLDVMNKSITSWSYKKLMENKEAMELIDSIHNKMMKLTVTSSDYADWFNETWSWKEFFGSEKIWNEHVDSQHCT